MRRNRIQWSQVIVVIKKGPRESLVLSRRPEFDKNVFPDFGSGLLTRPLSMERYWTKTGNQERWGGEIYLFTLSRTELEGDLGRVQGRVHTVNTLR